MLPMRTSVPRHTWMMGQKKKHKRDKSQGSCSADDWSEEQAALVRRHRVPAHRYLGRGTYRCADA